MMKRLLLNSFVLLCLLFSYTVAYAQGKTISGKVTSKEDGTPLPGVTVMVKGTTVGTQTDVEGMYKLSVSDDAKILVFSFVGMKTEEREIGNQSTIDFVMSADATEISEVVVTAFGVEKQKKALSYASQEVKGGQLTAVGQPNVVNGLQGKVAGVIVRQSSGMPGASSQITIRGSRSLDGNNQPLYVVDGLPISSDSDFNNDATVSGTDASSRSLDINPDDIESMSVLKGPAASALYGLRASNGVILITTKRGKNSKGKVNINYNSNYSFDNVSVLPELQSTYAQGSGGAHSQSTSLSWGPKIAEMQPFALRPGNIPATVLNRTETPKVYDNVTPFFKTGSTWNQSLDLSSGNADGNYGIGVGYTNQDGVIAGTGMTRVTAKISGDYVVNPKLKVGGSLNYSDVSIDKLPGGSNLSNPLFTTYFAPRTYDLWGIPYNFPGDPSRQIHYRGAMDNPRWSLANNKFNEATRRVFGSFNLSYKAFDWLTVNYRAGTDFYSTDAKEYYARGSGGTGGRPNPPATGAIAGGSINDYVISRNQFNSNFFLTFDKTFKESINVNLMVGNELYDNNSRLNSYTGTGLGLPNFDNISNASTVTALETINKRRVVGFYANLAVSWKNQLFLTASGRNDYVSFLAAGNRSFFYPSVGLAWDFSETFKIDQNILSFGKIRASYALVGQAPNTNYNSLTPFVTNTVGSGYVTDNIQFPFNGLLGFTQSNILRNPALRPQNTSTFEIGTELKFLRNRISIEYTYFSANVTDQIFQVPVSPATGYTSALVNAGELKNTGHELMLNVIPVQTNNIKWEIITNFTAFRNEVISLSPGIANITLGGFSGLDVRAQAGSLYPVIFAQRYLRDSGGNIVVDGRKDIDGSPNDAYGYPVADPTAGVVGTVQPDFEVGFTNRVTYKGLTLSAQLDWRQGGQMYSGNNRLGKFYGILKSTEDRETANYVQKGNLATFDADGNPIIDANGKAVSAGANTIAITRDQAYWQTVDAIDESNVFSTTFVRLREVALNYTLPSKWFTSTKVIKGVSVYGTARNLFLITDYPNFDPETSTGGGASNFQGLEYVALPQMRSYGFGLRASF
jgi:TonB-linked SusC/RagA family outer membrane protein